MVACTLRCFVLILTLFVPPAVATEVSPEASALAHKKSVIRQTKRLAEAMSELATSDAKALKEDLAAVLKMYQEDVVRGFRGDEPDEMRERKVHDDEDKDEDAAVDGDAVARLLGPEDEAEEGEEPDNDGHERAGADAKPQRTGEPCEDFQLNNCLKDGWSGCIKISRWSTECQGPRTREFHYNWDTHVFES